MYSENNSNRFKYSHIETDYNRFHAIFLIDAKSGLTFLSKKFSAGFDQYDEFNEDLISGFLNAINYFVREINSASESIQEINFKNSRILYDQVGRLMVIAISKKTDIVVERKIISNILDDFYNSYKFNIENFKGNIQVFKKFRSNLERYHLTGFLRSGDPNDLVEFKSSKME